MSGYNVDDRHPTNTTCSMGILNAIIASGSVGGGTDAASLAFYKKPFDQVEKCGNVFSDSVDDDNDDLMREILGQSTPLTKSQGKTLLDKQREKNIATYGGLPRPTEGSLDIKNEYGERTDRTHIIQMFDDVPFICCRAHVIPYIVASRTHHSTRHVINPWPSSSPIPYDYVMNEKRIELEKILRKDKKRRSQWILDKFNNILDKFNNDDDDDQTTINIIPGTKLIVPPNIDTSGL